MELRDVSDIVGTGQFGVFVKTVEGGGAVLQKVTARFARYGSMEECFAARDRILLSAPVYAEARSHRGEGIAFIHSLAKHWATDPAYAEKLEELYRRNGFAYTDSAG